MMSMFIVILSSNAVLVLELKIENPRRKFAAVEKEMKMRGVEPGRIKKIIEI